MGSDDERWNLPSSDRRRLSAGSGRGCREGREKVEGQVWRNVGEAGSGEPGAREALRARSSDVDLILELPYGPRGHEKAAMRGRTHGSTRTRAATCTKDSSCIRRGVHTWPCGTPDRQRSPRGALPLRRAIFVERPVSSMNTSLAGSRSSWPVEPFFSRRQNIRALVLAAETRGNHVY